MAKVDDNLFPKLIIRESADDGSDFSNPSADYRVLFLGEDGDLHLKDSSGTVTTPGGGGSGAFVGCVAQRTTDQTGIVTATGTIVSFTGTDIIDTDGFHDPGGANPSRIIIPSGKDGKYRFSAMILWEANATGVRQIGILVGGATFIGLHSHPAATAGEFTYQSVTSVPVDLVATNYVEVHVMQGSGGNRSLLGATVPLLFSCEYLGT